MHDVRMYKYTYGKDRVLTEANEQRTLINRYNKNKKSSTVRPYSRVGIIQDFYITISGRDHTYLGKKKTKNTNLILQTYRDQDIKYCIVDVKRKKEIANNKRIILE